MKNQNLKSTLKKAGLVFAAAFAFVIFSSVDASAQWNGGGWGNNRRNDRRDDRRDRRDDRRDDRRNNGGYNNGGYNNGNYGGGYYNDMYRVAREFGYRDGVAKGREEFYEGDRYNPESTRPYKNGLNGYERRFGNKDAYKQAYRQAFLQGFRQGYGRGNNNRRNNGGWGW